MRVRFAPSIVAAVVVLGAVSAQAQVVTLAEAARDAAGRTGSGTLSGVVTLPPGISVDVVVVRLRDAVTGKIRLTTIAGPDGQFAFEGLDGLEVAEYFIEVLDSSGVILSVSRSLTVGVGEVVDAVMRVPSTTGFTNILTNALASREAFTEAASSVLTSAAGAGVTAVGPLRPAVSPER